MSYYAPFVDSLGFHMPTYPDIRDQLILDAQNIFGQDIYVGVDSQDYQWIAIVAEKIYDAFQTASLVYNNRGPNVAIGVGLDSIIKINGIKRKAATYSTCTVTLSGVPNTIINNGVITDKGSIKWDLPTTVTIPISGTTDILATCQIPGPIVSNPGDLINIFNPSYGWNGVYNSESGELGSNIESDSDLRIRQSNSTAEPSSTVLEGTRGAVAQIVGVTRSTLYENDSNITDANGLPAHSITEVVEGGKDNDIAQAIFIHKTPGCYTNGTTPITITDGTWEASTIRFFRPTYVDIDVTVNVKKLAGYTTSTTNDILINLQTFLNSLAIGSDLSISSLWGISLQAMPSLVNPMFSVTSITTARHGETQTFSDVVLAFNEVCRGDVNYIVVNVV